VPGVPAADAPLEFVNLAEVEASASERLSLTVLDYYRGGANDEVTLRENRRAFDRLALRPRVLRDVSERSLSTTVLGRHVSTPILIAPTALQRMAHADGERATARAAEQAGTIFTVSTLATTSAEEVRAASQGRMWFQLYVHQDREATRDLVQRVEAVGYEALVLTVDTPILGRRERDVRNRFRLPPGLVIANLIPEGQEVFPQVHAGSGLAVHASHVLDPALSWRDVGWLAATTRLPIIVKGIVRGDDAGRAAAEGVAAIIVSNHGGRQLDTAIATITALPEVAAAVGDRLEVYVDGGVRRGTDVIKAIALGARAVLLGRPVLWGLAVGGEQGVTRVLEILRDELDLAMALCGCRSVDEITRDLVAGA
jgi:4-hydroxymandelate oxidase